MKRLLYLWHRRIGVLVLVPLLMFTLSGLLHPTMRLTRPEPAKMFYPAPVWPAESQHWLSPSQLVSQNPITISQNLSLSEITGIRPVKLGEQWFFQLWQDRNTSSVFLDAHTGAVQSSGVQQYAEQLARHYSGDKKSAVLDTQLITQFSSEYPEVNRLLPVWKVSFERDDGLTVFVDIRQDRLGTLSDDLRQNLMGLFQIMHVWSFMDQDNPLRTPLLILSMVSAIALAISGVYLFVVLPIRQRKKAHWQKWHSYTGASISLILLAFCLSGLVRTVEKISPELRGISVDQAKSLATVQIGFGELKQQFAAVNGAVLHQLDGQPVWQVLQARKPEVWLNASNGELISGGAYRYSEQLLQQVSQNRGELFNLTGLDLSQAGSSQSKAQISQQLTGQRYLFKFKDDPDYGFIDKRLPVYAMTYGERSFYVDTRDSTLSTQVQSSDRAFTWVFRYLHKWRFADGLGLNARDGLMALSIVLICLTGGIGGALWWRRRRKSRVKSEAVFESSPSKQTEPA